MAALSGRGSLCPLVVCLALSVAGSQPVAAQGDWTPPQPRSESIAGYTLWLEKVPLEDRFPFGYYTLRVFLPAPSHLGSELIIPAAWDFYTFGSGDITGDGYPDVVVELYSGGVHCCYTYVVLSLGPELRVIPLPLRADGPATFVDLDDDGIYEVLGWDPIFHYVYCGHPQTPWAQVILGYEEGRGYVPVSPQFPEAYDALIERHTVLAEQVKQGLHGGPDDLAKCMVLHLVLDYLYSGRSEEAWAALYEYYPYPDVLEFHQEIVIRLGLSDLYVPPEEHRRR